MDKSNSALRPINIDVKKSEALTIEWSDGVVSKYPVKYLRKMSPSADARDIREKLKTNPLTVLPSLAGTKAGDSPKEDNFKIENVIPAGNYAIRVIFSDGHRTGIYSWQYLRDIDPKFTDN